MAAAAAPGSAERQARGGTVSGLFLTCAAGVSACG
jgi:hypothetical protein